MSYGVPADSYVHTCEGIQISTAWVIEASQSAWGRHALKDISLTWAPPTGLEHKVAPSKGATISNPATHTPVRAAYMPADTPTKFPQ